MTIRVVVVDDSALVRSVLSGIINAAGDMWVVGMAPDPHVAREMIRELNPDVITLDVEMPHMDGLDFLERLMRLRPMPVVMVSTLTARGAEVTLRALELGAVECVSKPRFGAAAGLEHMGYEVVAKIRAAAMARVGRRATAAVPVAQVPRHIPTGRPIASKRIIAIGASTGGTEAIREVLRMLPADGPGIVITQHMPSGFTASFAARLDAQCAMRVKEAQEGEAILQGHAYVAPGGRHLRIRRQGAGYVAEVDDGDPVNRHRPSVEVLFRSVAQHAGSRSLGVMLTGMGADGALGMRAMRDAGGYNVVQDEASCVVFGMPREAIAAGAADVILPLQKIGIHVLERLRSRMGTVS